MTLSRRTPNGRLTPGHRRVVKLLAANLLVGSALVGLHFIDGRTSIGDLGTVWFFAIAVFLCLGAVDLIIFGAWWTETRWWGLVPGVAWWALIPAILWASSVSNEIALRDTPARPSTFFVGPTRDSLTAIARTLLAGERQSIELRARSSSDPAARLDSTALVEPGDRALARYGFHRVYVDHKARVVTLGHYLHRRWYEYRFAESGLPSPYTSRTTITAEDFSDWRELRKIARQGNDTADCVRARIVFEPPLAYPILERGLPPRDLAFWRDSVPGAGGPQRARVVALFDSLHRIESRLLENSEVRFMPGEDPTLRIAGGAAWGRSFPAVQLLTRLVADSAIRVIDREGHMRISARLTPTDSARIEWAQVEVLDATFGNLIQKADYEWQTALGNGWYLHRW